jgi:hypothetical protein
MVSPLGAIAAAGRLAAKPSGRNCWRLGKNQRRLRDVMAIPPQAGCWLGISLVKPEIHDMVFFMTILVTHGDKKEQTAPLTRFAYNPTGQLSGRANFFIFSLVTL